MALIKCKECGKEISDSAKQCPHCGCTTKFGGDLAMVKGQIVTLMVAAGAGLIGTLLFFPNFGKIIKGIDKYRTLTRWLSTNDEAFFTLMVACVGIGVLIGACILAFRVAREMNWLSKIGLSQNSGNNDPSVRIPDELVENMKKEDNFTIKRKEPAATINGWQCSCGRVNANYVSTCACGKNKRDQ